MQTEGGYNVYYYWWGAKSQEEVSLVYFDSLYLEPRIYNDDKTGNFSLRYAIGDENYWDRNPADDLSDPIPITVHDYSDVDELFGEANINIYPNPTSDLLNIDFAEYRSQVIHMQIVDMAGKTVLNTKIMSGQNSFDLSDLPDGTYFVNLQNGKNSTVNKIVIQ